MLFTLAWRNLWRNKRRTLITIASVFFAVLLAIFMRSLQEGIYSKMIENAVSFYTGYVQIHKDGYWDEQILDNSFEQMSVVKTVAGSHESVQALVPRIESFALASSGEISEGSLVLGVDPTLEAKLTKLDAKVAKGAYFSGSGPEALVAEGLAEKLELELGDTLVLFGAGYHGSTAAGLFEIKGFLHFGSPELNSRLVYLPLDEAQVLYGAEERLTAYVLNLENPQTTEGVVADMRSELTEDYEVMDWKEMMPDIVQFIELDRSGGYMFMFILYTVIGFGLFGTVLMMTAERKYEFGVLTAIGMKRHKLAITVLLEMLFIGMLGVLIGALVSLPIVAYFQANPIYIASMADAYEEFGLEPILPTIIDGQVFFNQGLVVFIFTILISIYPMIKISRLDPVKSMRA